MSGWIVYSSESGGAHSIRAAEVDTANGNRTTNAFSVSQSGNELPEPGAPEVAIIGGTPTLTWWKAEAGSLNASLRGARVQASGSVTDRFRATVQGNTAGATELIAAASANGELYLAYPDFSSGSGVLQLLEVAPGDTGSLSGGTAITGSNTTNRAPSAVPVDPNGDGTAEELAVSWEQGNTTDPSIMIGSTSLSSPSQMSEREIASNFPMGPDFTLKDRKAGTIWLNKANQNSKDVKYAPISIDGVPVCSPNP